VPSIVAKHGPDESYDLAPRTVRVAAQFLHKSGNQAVRTVSDQFPSNVRQFFVETRGKQTIS
jgi:hypothetical protein